MKRCAIFHFRLFTTYVSLFQEGYKLYYRQMVAQLHINPLNVELNPICHLLALFGAHTILHVSRIRVNKEACVFHNSFYYSIHPL
jgi:hypothetical protein